MAVRRPIKIVSGGNLREMTSAEIDEIQNQVIVEYGNNPSVVLSIVVSGGSLSSIDDTRLQAGAYSTSISSFPSELVTAEPSEVTVTYDKVDETVTSLSFPTIAQRPLYVTGGDLQEMSVQDMIDTFITPVVPTLTSGSTTTSQAGTYTVSTSSSLAGSTLVSGTPLFSDTRANTAAYSAAAIPTTLDQPTTITDYYLHRINSGSEVNHPNFVYWTGSALRAMQRTTSNGYLSDLIRYVAAQDTGNTIRYNITGTGNNRGTGIVNTRLNGSGNWQTRFVTNNDYRAQEFPDGTPTTISTDYLRIQQV